jgi:hypothetical protein
MELFLAIIIGTVVIFAYIIVKASVSTSKTKIALRYGLCKGGDNYYFVSDYASKFDAVPDIRVFALLWNDKNTEIEIRQINLKRISDNAIEVLGADVYDSIEESDLTNNRYIIYKKIRWIVLFVVNELEDSIKENTYKLSKISDIVERLENISNDKSQIAQVKIVKGKLKNNLTELKKLKIKILKYIGEILSRLELDNWNINNNSSIVENENVVRVYDEIEKEIDDHKKYLEAFAEVEDYLSKTKSSN